MNWIKKISLRIFILLYGVSYLLQNSIFVDRRKVYATENPDTTNLVAVFVDKDIYKDITTDLVRYTTRYIQRKISNSKAIVFPIDTTTLKAHEISQILENMYFEGLEDEPSKLVGTILIGNIPLPVVQNNGFIYPSIYPYVDFEDQQFIYDTNEEFFVYNNNPNGQAEIWHGLIQFDTIEDYESFFIKVRSYYNDPTAFVDKTIRYDDFIGLKKYFIPENTKYYVNNLIFSEDIGYHRFTSLLLDTLTSEHNNETLHIWEDLASSLENTEDEELKTYGEMIGERSEEANEILKNSSANMPTLTLMQSTQEMTKTYDELISTMFLSTIKDNIESAARRYKNTEGATFVDINGTTNKIVQQDNRMIGDLDNNIQSILIQANEYMEKQLNEKIEEEKYYLTVPVPVGYLKVKGDTKKEKCVRPTYEYYHNYYFGKDANYLKSVEETNIYEGTYQNLTSLSGQTINPLQSIGVSYKTFSVQVEANRWYNIGNAGEELDLYNKNKINKQELRWLHCPKYLFNWEGLNICIKKRIRMPDDADEENKCVIANEEQQGWCESMTGFSWRNWWGASPLNLDENLALKSYAYTGAKLPIYDIAGSKAISTPEPEAHTYEGVKKYAALIQEKLGAGDLQYSNDLSFLIKYPQLQGSDLYFTNQYPYGNLKNPTWGPKSPLTYNQTNFFTIFSAMPSRTVEGNKAVLYKWIPANDDEECNVEWDIYTYTTIDTRIYNISPTPEQISDTEFFKFKPESDIWIFYNDTITTLKQTWEDIQNSKATFITGTINSLNTVKTAIINQNNGINQIIAYPYTNLSWASSATITNLANTRNNYGINYTKMMEISGNIQEINKGLATLRSYINTVSIRNVHYLFENIIQTEKYKNQNVEILESWKTNIITELNTINNKINEFKTQFTQARGTYNTLSQINNIAAIQTKRNNIASLQGGYWCSATYYKSICDVLDTIIGLTTTITEINEKIDKIESYQSTATDQRGGYITVAPFTEINTIFNENEIGGEIIATTTILDTFSTTTDTEKTEIKKGMNITTADRPIDNIRNITFKGIGGDTVKLIYPNLYEVEVYKETEDTLILKSPEEIRKTLKTYLINKAVEHNTILENQKNKKNTYYGNYSVQFNFLGQLDNLANPNTHEYDLLPTNFFIQKLIEYLDELQERYGTTYIYGNTVPTTNDEKLDLFAHFLYQHNITWPEKIKTTEVIEHINETKTSFDINHKIGNTIKTYLTENNDQWALLTPTYNSNGYEVGFINSDGMDYISAQSIPSFIQQIQSITSTQAKTETPTKTNLFVEDSTQNNTLQQSVDTCAGVDTKGTALLFDFKTFSSPWIQAMKCWAEKILEKPFDIQINFKEALGPTVMGTYNELQNSIQNFWSEWKTYGEQRSTPNNDDIIAQTSGEAKEALIEYNNYALVDIDKNIIENDSTGDNKIHIRSAKDIGNIKISIKAIGDVCFSLNKENETKTNICEDPWEWVFNPYQKPTIFTLTPTAPKAGTTAIQIKICEPKANTEHCITKTKIINILPGPIHTIDITTPPIVMEWSEIPIILNAQDQYGNKIGQTIAPYIISVASGNGLISKGAASDTNIEFDNFNQASFIYQAPKELTANKNISINIAKKETAAMIGTETETEINTQKNIIVAKGIIKIQQNATTLFKTKTNEEAETLQSGSITFMLPKDEKNIQYIDEHELPQIVAENIPSILITVQDPNENNLETIANITTKNWTLIPGSIIEKNISKENETFEQTIFSKTNDFIIQDGELSVTLYPSFKAGNDILTIYIPGIDPIKIPITVYAGEAKKVILNLEKTKLNLTNNTSSKGSIQVVDTWNNNVNIPTTVKLGTIGAAKTNTNEFTYSGGTYEYTLTSESPGGEGYIFAYVANRPLTEQSPGYERFIVQESILPKEKLNIMYLNLFWTDRGNQRGYFSENEKTINDITAQSNKLLATTTQLVDQTKIKKITYLINEHGQIQDFDNGETNITFKENKIIAHIPEKAEITLGTTTSYTIETRENRTDIKDIEQEENIIIYIPEATDSIVTNNKSTKKTISINNKEILNLNEGTIDPSINITAQNKKEQGMSIYDMTQEEKKIGTIYIRTKEIKKEAIDLKDPITYGKTEIFSEGSTNSKGIGIYLQTSAFSKQGYESIEDSANAELGIGFTNKFKNISNFANGQQVGEATIPYGSHFLINFWDPLLERIDDNEEIPDTDFDAAGGQTIYADPTKTILKTLPIDFNNDDLTDLLIVYTDGTVKLLKNYGGKESYKNLQELMLIAEPIKDVHIGDVDGNDYNDIIIITNNNKGLVYLNNEGIFAVDGKNICLNTNTEPNIQNPNPEDFSNIKQLFLDDMNQDGSIDIITNDSFNDTKIFYGGGDNEGGNYLSTTNGSCDANRYQRQKNNYQTVKRFGIRINGSRYIQDAQSIIHRKNNTPPAEGIEEEINEEGIDTSNYTKEELIELVEQSKEDISNFVQNLNGYIDQGITQLAYLENPLDTAPIYESINPEEIYYLPINEENDTISVYKEYKDMNSGILRDGDEVVVQTTIYAKKNNTKATYIDALQWPRKIIKDTENKIVSFAFIQGDTWNLQIDRNTPEGYQFMIDNIVLDAEETIQFSYTIIYKATEIIEIDIEDVALPEENKEKDGYPDITFANTDPCQKGRWILFNTTAGEGKNYEEFFEDLQESIDEYTSNAEDVQATAITALIESISNMQNINDLQNISGLSANPENRKSANMLTPIEVLSGIFERATNQWGWINVSTNFIDTATAKVSKKIDETLEGMCKGFTLGKWDSAGCNGIPVPFNQAFLAPGNYHIFGCVPQAPNPLYVPFKLLNQTLGKGIPVLAFPTNSIVPTIRPPSPISAGGIFWWTTSQFRLYVAPTLTLWLGIAMCFWPYSLGIKIPKPFSDIGGNCLVFALPPITKCPEEVANTETPWPHKDEQDNNIAGAGEQWTCNQPAIISQTPIISVNGTTNQMTETVSSPFEIVAAGSSQNANPSYSAAIPQWNFWGIMVINQEPITTTSELGDTNIYDGYELKQGEKINLKILGAKSKGLVQCLVNDWMTKQIQYIQNNLTKMTIQLDLPDLSTVFQGFDKIGNLVETYENINTQDEQAGYIQETGEGDTALGMDRTQKISQQKLTNITQKVGNNPFEAVQEIFKEVPLVNIETQDITIKIPAITSEDIKKYQNYLKVRTAKAEQTLIDRDEMFTETLQLCSRESWEEQINKKDEILQSIKDLEKIQKNKELTEEQKLQLTNLKGIQRQVEQCLKIWGQYSNFISFQENSAGLIRSIKQNINVLEKYKEFPNQLHARTHLNDRYFTELSAILNEFMDSTTYRLNTNANRYSDYVDAIITMVGAIKTRQVIIDFSVNRSERCSKCSNDNYGSFSCSLSFLCPKLPIFPIPAFKIPNIYMDMSHIELGMNIILPKINFVPIKIPLPEIPNLPEPPTIEVNRDIMYGINLSFFEEMSMPTIPVIPEPPTLPEPPSFIPSINIDLPVLPPAPKIPNIVPEINGVLKVADFIGKIFCIVKWGIGLVGEKSVKAKIEQITQRTWNVPIFDYFDLTTKYTDPPLQWFDYQLDAYATLKFNFDGVYDVFNNIANVSNNIMNQYVEPAIQSGVNRATDKMNNNQITNTGFEFIEKLDQDINLNGYHQEPSDMVIYTIVQQQLKQWLLDIKQSTITDKVTNDQVKNILAIVDNQSTVTPNINGIETVKKAATNIIKKNRDEQLKIQEQLKDYDNFIKNLEATNIVLVNDTNEKVELKTNILDIDNYSKNILDMQEDPTKTYLDLNKNMVEGYLNALYNDGPEKLNMTQSTYNKSQTYLETTKNKIDQALFAYNDTDQTMLAQSTCTNCGNNGWSSQYSTDISAYVKGIFIEDEEDPDTIINTVVSTQQIENIGKQYRTDIDINNDNNNDILMYDNKTVYIKYAEQEQEHFSKWGNSITRNPSNTFYSYAKEHTRNRYISSLEQLRDNSDNYGYTDINNISIKIIDKNKEVKKFTTKGQTFDTLQMSWKNSKWLGESVDGYIIKITKKIDQNDIPRSFWDILGNRKKEQYVVLLPKNTEYEKWLLTIDKDMVKKPINLEIGDSILAVEYYDPEQDTISVSLKELPREWLYTSIASLIINQDDLTSSQQKRFTLYKKASPRSNQTVAGMQNLGDITAPTGEIMLRRNLMNKAISTGIIHEGVINTNYTLKSIRTDEVTVKKMIIQQDWITKLEKENDSQTGTLDLWWLFFTGTNEQTFDFIAIDQNNNITKETVRLTITIPEIEIIDLQKSGEETADIIAQITNDMDEGMVIFQRLRNNMRQNIEGSNQNEYGGFNLFPGQTIITGGIFTIGNDIGLYDSLGNEIAIMNPETGEITLKKDTIEIQLNFDSHIPIVELKDITNNITLFQIVLPIKNITDIRMAQNTPTYQQIQLPDSGFGTFNNGYCIKNTKNDCILYTNNQGWIYIPGTYATSLEGNYMYDTETHTTSFLVKDQDGTEIVTITFSIKPTK